MSSSATVPSPSGAGFAWKRHLSLENRFVPPIFITLILLAGQLSYGILESYSRTALAISVSIAAELILGRIFLKRWPNVASAYISGISVGIFFARLRSGRMHFAVRWPLLQSMRCV
jgi:hypothetical protein